MYMEPRVGEGLVPWKDMLLLVIGILILVIISERLKRKLGSEMPPRIESEEKNMAGKFKMPSIKDVEQEENKDEVVKEKFKVGAGLLSDISKGSVVMKVVNIPREQLQKNPKNQYSISGITSLAESIKQYGLLQPLHVMETENGYRLLGGERRLTAIDTLIKDDAVSDWTEDTLIPCVVKDAEDVKLDLSPENKERYAIITSIENSELIRMVTVIWRFKSGKKIIDELRSKKELNILTELMRKEMKRR